MKPKDINFEYIEDFVDYVVEETENDEDIFVTVIAKFDEAKEILKNLMLYEDVNFDFLEIEDPVIDNYQDEFIISLWMNDGVLEIGCEKLKDEKGDYTNPCGDIVYLVDDCSSRIIPLCDGAELHFVGIKEECDCDDCCDGCECECDCHCSDIDIANSGNSSHKINGTPVTEAEFNKKYKELHEKHEKNVRNILKDYCSFMDDVNTILAQL